MAVIAQRQRPLETVRERREPSEMRDPFVVGQRIEADRSGRALVAIAQDVIRKCCRRDEVIEVRTKRGMAGGGAVA